MGTVEFIGPGPPCDSSKTTGMVEFNATGESKSSIPPHGMHTWTVNVAGEAVAGSFSFLKCRKR